MNMRTITMNKTLLIATTIIFLSGCAQEITKEPAQVTSHSNVGKSLDGCDRLGEIKSEYEINKDLDRRENKIQSQADIKQRAYDEYRADNIVFISTQYVEGGFRVPDKIFTRSIAYKCYEK